eukprot:8632120-Lingulodinium_polyedra.AAC.1
MRCARLWRPLVGSPSRVSHGSRGCRGQRTGLLTSAREMGGESRGAVVLGFGSPRSAKVPAAGSFRRGRGGGCEARRRF